MSLIFEWLYQVIRQITLVLGYPGIFLLMLVENMIPPVPSEMVMPFSGFMIADGELNFAGVIIAGTLGSVAGAVIIYYIGYKLGHDRLRTWICRWGKFMFLSGEDLDRSLDTFNRHGKSAIFVGRLIPGVRSLISIPAGINKMPMGEFIGLTLLGTLGWNLTLTTAGVLLGSNWRKILDIMDTYELVIWAVTGLLLLWFLVRRLGRRAPQTGC